MTIAELKDRIEAIPPGSQVPRDWLLEQLKEMPEANYGSMTWSTIKEASQISGLSEKYLRGRAPGWASFNKPEIRVWKMNPDKKGSHWLFSTEDCEAYRGAREDERSGPEIVPDHTGDPDDMDAMLEHYSAKATANL